MKNIYIVAGLVLTTLICALIYFPGLSGSLLLDDNPQLGPLLELADTNKEALMWEHLFSNSGVLGRPVAMASFIINAMVFGNDIWYWKLVNLLIHVLTGWVIFFFTASILKKFLDNKSSQYVALLTTAIWLLHPIQVSTVLYTVQRMAQLSTLFVFLGLLCYVRGRDIVSRNALKGWLLIAVGFMLFFPLSVFSKENGAVFPLLVLLIEVLLFRFELDKQQRKYLMGLFTVFLWVPLLLGIGYLAFNPEWLMSGYDARDFTLLERVLTQCRVLVYYWYQLLVPVASNMGFFHDDIVVSKSLIEPLSTLFSIIFLLGLLFLSWLLRKKYPLFSFAVMFYFIAHLLESTIFSLELMFEHRNYMASYGVFLLFAFILHKVFSQRKGIVKMMPVVVILFACLILAFRVQAWSSEDSMYLYMFKQRPESKRLTAIVANYYAENGFYANASKLLTKFDGLGFKVNLLYLKCKQQHTLSASDFETIVIQNEVLVNMYANEAIINLANLGLDDLCQFDSFQFIRLVDEALNARMLNNSVRQKLLMYKAHYFHREDRLQDAVTELDNAYGLYNGNPMPLFLASEWFIESNQLQLAEKYYKKAVKISLQSGKNYSEFINRVGQRIKDIK